MQYQVPVLSFKWFRVECFLEITSARFLSYVIKWSYRTQLITLPHVHLDEPMCLSINLHVPEMVFKLFVYVKVWLLELDDRHSSHSIRTGLLVHVWLEQEVHVGAVMDAITFGQGRQLVFVQNWVQWINLFWVELQKSNNNYLMNLKLDSDTLKQA